MQNTPIVDTPLIPLAMDVLSLPTPSSALLRTIATQPRSPTTGPVSVYVLELEGGRVYVGSSKDVERRIAQHMAGTGSAYTRTYKPTGVRLPRLGNVMGDGDAAERDETLRYMHQRGIAYVRGWRFSQVAMNATDFNEAESNIRELFNLCRRCGYPGHFMNRCRATYDRWGILC
jgi:predicted GIY-YIG superfamily endonuclease